MELNYKAYTCKTMVFSLFLMLCNFQLSCSTDNKNSEDYIKYYSKTQDAKKLQDSIYAEVWQAPDTASIPFNEQGNLIRFGRELVANSSAYFGPKGSIHHFANVLNCQSCHQNAGTKQYAYNYSGVYSTYPKFRARSGTIEDLEKRINDCIERSLNGKKLDRLSKEMQAIVAYINWVGKDVKKGTSPMGVSVVDLKFLSRPANQEKGEMAYKKHCISCHGEDGQGKQNPDSSSYLYPPLWGPKSYTTAAGLFRLSRFAGFIKSNMPHLSSTYDKPILTDEESWDIAAYVNSMPRPHKIFKMDWPDISKKPYDHPYGPFSDKFSETQHKYGPFEEIIDVSKTK